jgi:hypothetical protein
MERKMDRALGYDVKRAKDETVTKIERAKVAGGSCTVATICPSTRISTGMQEGRGVKQQENISTNNR